LRIAAAYRQCLSKAVQIVRVCTTADRRYAVASVSGAPQAWFYRLLGVVAVAAVVAVVAGCGGSGYTKSDFVARADAICTGTLRQTRALVPPASTSQPGGPLAAYFGQLVPLVQSEADQLRALKRPPGNARDSATLTEYENALAQIVANYRQLEAAARRGDTQTVTDVEATLRASPAAALATSYGLRSCGTPGSTSVGSA
jgi:hypothetical protein